MILTVNIPKREQEITNGDRGISKKVMIAHGGKHDR